MHPTELPSYVVDRIVVRRGRLHGFEQVDSAKTALVVVDMQNVFCAPGAAVEVPTAREIVPNINRLAHATRDAGGLVVWVQMTVARHEDWALVLDNLVTPEVGATTLAGIKPGSEGHALWPKMEPAQGDLYVAKNRFSAFLPSSSNIAELLRGRGIEYVIVTGTLTNVCCESSARDANMMNFRTAMVSDGNAALTQAEHEASLTAFYATFGDVMDTDMIIAALERGGAVKAA